MNMSAADMANGMPALIVGGTSGLGLALTNRLVADGCQVTTVGRRARPDGVAKHYVCDLGDSDAWGLTLNQIAADHSHLGLTAFVTGFARAIPPAATLSIDRRNHYRLNADYVADAHATLAELWRDGAAVLTIGTQWTYRIGCPYLIPYIMAKSALLALTQEMAASHRQAKIRHYCVPTMQTPGYERVKDSFRAAGFAREFYAFGLETDLASPGLVASAIIEHMSRNESDGLLWRVYPSVEIVGLLDVKTVKDGLR